MKLFHYGLALAAATVLLSGCSNNEPEQPQPAVFIPGNSEVEIRFGAKTVKIEVLAVAEAVRKDDAAAMYRELTE